MKTSNMIIKPLATVSIIALSIFSCARTDSGRVTTNTGNEPMAGTTTDTEPTDRTTNTTGTETTPTDRTTTGTETTTGGTTTGSETMGGTETTGGTTTGTETMGEGTTGTQTQGETQTTGGTTTGTQTQGQDGTMTTDQENLSNPVSYDEMFSEVENTEQYDVMTLARMDENLSTFVQLVEQAGLEQSFNFAEPITLFAPTNEAFQSLSKERYEYLTDPENRAELISVLQAHVIPSEVSSIAFSDNQRIVDSEGNEIPVDTEMQGTAVFVGGAEIVRSDIEASNGIIHVVNGVIDPSEEAPGMGPRD